MKKTIFILAVFSIGVFLGVVGSLGVVGALDSDASSESKSTTDTMNTEAMQTDSVKEMMHGAVEIDASLPIPSVRLESFPDSKSGYNIRIATENFTFTPENVGQENVPNTGHTHLYVNNNKVTRVYGEWVHIPSTQLAPGSNTIEVTLNANDHSDWLQNDEHISATITVQN